MESEKMVEETTEVQEVAAEQGENSGVVPEAEEKPAEKQEKAPEVAPKYELTIIFIPQMESEALDTRIDGISKMIQDKGGVVCEVDRWGKKKLAYPIKHSFEGHYVHFKYDWDASLNRELESHLGISEDVLRHLVIKIDE